VLAACIPLITKIINVHHAKKSNNIQKWKIKQKNKKHPNYFMTIVSILVKSHRSYFYVWMLHAQSEIYSRGEENLYKLHWYFQEEWVPGPSLIFRVIKTVILNSLGSSPLLPETEMPLTIITEMAVYRLLPYNHSDRRLGSMGQQIAALFQFLWEAVHVRHGMVCH
jgi:hypothetical protein